ncbi:MAG: T9SS type A sorting domain-containing protein [Bacteroidota bacterium]
MQKTLLFLIGGLLLSLHLEAQIPATPIFGQSGCDGDIVFNVEGDACGACELRLFKDKIPANDPNDEDEAVAVTNGSEVTFDDLCTGLYRFALYNADFDCYYFYDFEVQMELCQLSLTGISKKDEICGDDGSVLATINADNHPPFQYQLLNAAGNVIQTVSSNDFSYTFEGLSEGSYSVRVTNYGACVVNSGSVQIVDLESEISIDNVATTTDECGFGNGSITLEVSGGSGQYSYSWSPNGGFATGGSPFTISGLDAATYDIDVSDTQSGGTGGNGSPTVCSTSTTATIIEEDTGNCDPPPCSGFSVSIDVDCSVGGKFDFELTANVAGNDAGPFTYAWTVDGTNVGNNQSITLNFNNFTMNSEICVTVNSTSTNCNDESCITAATAGNCGNSSTARSSVFNVPSDAAYELKVSLQPNPFQDQVELNLSNPIAQNIFLKVLDNKGTLVQTRQLFLEQGTHSTTLDLSDLSSGTYQLLFIGDKTAMQVERVVKME